MHMHMQHERGKHDTYIQKGKTTNEHDRRYKKFAYIHKYICITHTSIHEYVHTHMCVWVYIYIYIYTHIYIDDTDHATIRTYMHT
jgi:hypothetical protein